MSRIVGSVSATLALFLSLGVLRAEAQVGLQPKAPEVSGPVAATEGPFAYPLRLRINDLVQGARDFRDRDLAAALVGFYGSRKFELVWVDAKGFRPGARVVIDEIRNAKAWGLDPTMFYLPPEPAAGADEYAMAAAEAQLSYAVLRYAAHARGGRVDPSQLSKWLDQKPKDVDAAAVLGGVAAAADPAAQLRALHPKHEGFHNLRKAYLKLVDPALSKTAAAEGDKLPPGPRIEPGQRHPDVRILRRRLGLIGTAADEDLYDDRLVEAVRRELKIGRKNVRPVVDARVRDVLNQPPGQAKGKKPDTIDAKKILVNMERWRWLPDDLGELHIWNSLTEFETRVLKGREVVHQERIIVGKPDTQTPVFSDKMEYLVFQPEWGVPNSIKVKQLLPALQDGNDGILDERGMKILVNGKEKDPGDYDWDKTDIRYVPVYQLPGPSNPLGIVKFMFPNKHDVYMHDTPQKPLFNDQRRTHSHGCIRVRNPRKLAELVMSIDQGWSEGDVGELLKPKAKPSNRIELRRPISVHNTYFTVIADAEGNVRSVADIYNHDKRIADALDGVPVERIAERDPARALERELEEIAPTGKSDGANAIILKTEKQRQAAAARKRSRGEADEETAYLPPPKPKYSGYSGLLSPAPKPAYYAPPPKKNTYRSPPTLFDMVNRW